MPRRNNRTKKQRLRAGGKIHPLGEFAPLRNSVWYRLKRLLQHEKDFSPLQSLSSDRITKILKKKDGGPECQ